MTDEHIYDDLLRRFDESMKRNAELREEVTQLIAQLRQHRFIEQASKPLVNYCLSPDYPKWERGRGALEDDR